MDSNPDNNKDFNKELVRTLFDEYRKISDYAKSEGL